MISRATTAGPSSSSSSHSPSAGPSTASTPPSSAAACSGSGSSSSSPARAPPGSRKPQAHKRVRAAPPPSVSQPALSMAEWRSTFLDAFPVLEKFVDQWCADGIWNGPISIFATDGLSDDEDDDDDAHGGDSDECSIKRKPKSKSARKGKSKVKDIDTDRAALRPRLSRKKGGSLWNQVVTHSKSLDIDAVRLADSRIVHCFLRAIGTPDDIFLLGTKFSTVLFPRCSCHSKAKVGDSLRIALEGIGLDKFNIHEFDRVVFPVEIRNRWFVVAVTESWVIVYDPAGFCRIEPEMVTQLADHIANAFVTDAAKWPDLGSVPENLDTRIISPDNPTDPSGSAILVCAALELMVTLPDIDDVYYRGLEMILWFLSECINKRLSHEQYRNLLSLAFKEAENQAKDTTRLPAKPRPRINTGAPKVPFKAKRRVKRTKTAAPAATVARHKVSPELASALQSARKAGAGDKKLAKALLDRVIWTCKTGQLPGSACTCALCCDNMLADLTALAGGFSDVD